jgi:hypothetical protein
VFFFFYLKHTILIQVHDEEEEGLVSFHTLQQAAEPTELEDVTNATYVPTRKDIMKAPLIPL